MKKDKATPCSKHRADGRASYLCTLASAFGLAGAVAQPANDHFAQREELLSLPPVLDGATLGATAEPGEPAHGFATPIHSVWWRWTAPSNGQVRVLGDNYYDPVVVAFYQGNAFGELRRAATSAVDDFWVVEAGQAYQIAADVASERSFQLRFKLFSTPLNDAFAQRAPLPALPFSGTADLAVATREPAEPPSPSFAAHNIWFTWTAPQDGWLHLKSQHSFVSFDIFTGDSVGSLAPVPTSTANYEYAFEARAGVTYQIAMGRRQLGQAHDEFLAVPWSAVFDPVPPNANLQTRILLDGTVGEVIADGHLIPNHVLWYEWSAPARGTLIVGGATAYVGDALSSLTTLQNNIAVTQGMSIKLSVQAPGQTRVTWQFYPLPANDSFAAAQLFSGEYAVLTGQNYGATREAREPSHGPEFAGGSIWYRWTAPADGLATWYVASPNALAVTRVYEGSSLARLRRVANQSPLLSPEGASLLFQFQAVGGKTYCFVADGRRGSGASGTFDLQFTFTTLRLNTEFTPAGGQPALLNVGFTGPDPAGVSAVSAAQYGLLYLDRFCPNFPIAGNEPGGVLRWTNPPPGRYLFYGVVSNQSGGTAVLSPLNLLIPPPNDDLANAEMVEGFEFSRLGVIAGSGREPREPSHGDAKGLGSIWWKWTPPADGFAEVDLTIYGHRFGYEPSDLTGITPSLAVYVRRNGKLVRIAGARRAKYTVGCRLQAEEGVTYFIAGQMPKGYYLSDCGGNAELRVRLAAAKVAPSVTGKTFKHRLPIPLEMQANFPLEEIDRVEFVEAQDLGRPAKVLAGTNVSPFRVIWEGAAKGPHRIAVRVFRNDGHSFTSDFVDLFVQTANDNFADAVVLTGVSPVFHDDVGYATREKGEPRETGPPYGDSVWYRWTAPHSGKWMLRIVGFGEAIYFYTGSTVSTLKPVSVQRNQGATLYWFDSTAGTTYHIAVKRNYIWPVPYELSLLPADAPINDSFANPTALSLGATQAIGTLRFATSQPDEPGDENASVWYTWTAPTNGVVAIKHSQGYIGTRIFAGSTLSSLQELPDLADPGVRFWAERWNCYRVEANQTYRLQVCAPLGYGDYLDPYWDLNANRFNVEMIFEPVPGNDPFATPFDLPSGSSILRGRGLGASSEPLDVMGGVPTAVTLWWTWQATATGTLSVTFSNIFVQAFHGATLGGLVPVPSTVHGIFTTVTNGESLRLCAYHYHQWAEPYEIQLNFQESGVAVETAAASPAGARPTEEIRIVPDSTPVALVLRLRQIAATTAEITVQGPAGYVFQIQTSPDLEAWQDLPGGAKVIAAEGETHMSISLSDLPRRFFRVRAAD